MGVRKICFFPIQRRTSHTFSIENVGVENEKLQSFFFPNQSWWLKKGQQLRFLEIFVFFRSILPKIPQIFRLMRLSIALKKMRVYGQKGGNGSPTYAYANSYHVEIVPKFKCIYKQIYLYEIAIAWFLIPYKWCQKWCD